MRPTNYYNLQGTAGPTRMMDLWGIQRPNPISHTSLSMDWRNTETYIDEDNDDGIHKHESANNPHRDSEFLRREDSMV